MPALPAPSTLVALQAAGRPLDSRDPAVARLAAGQLVSELFFKPLLAEMRNFDRGADLVHGGFAESVFAQQLDQRLADTLANTGGAGLVTQIAERLTARATTRPSAATGMPCCTEVAADLPAALPAATHAAQAGPRVGRPAADGSSTAGSDRPARESCDETA